MYLFCAFKLTDDRKFMDKTDDRKLMDKTDDRKFMDKKIMDLINTKT